MQSKNSMIIACAGSGKTWELCNKAISDISSDKMKLLITYTNKGAESLIFEYKKQNNGVLDKNVRIMTWYQFLLREMIKPYQSIYTNKIGGINSIDFSTQYGVDYSKKVNKNYYLNSNNDVKVNRVSEFALFINVLTSNNVIKRLELAYNSIFIDEVQDMVGKDVELIEELFKSNLKVWCVGDPKQSTLKTHNNKSNKDRSGRNLFDYFESKKDELCLNIKYNNKTKRFGYDIASFCNLVFSNNPIESISSWNEVDEGVYIISIKDLDNYAKCYNPVVLRDDKRTETFGHQAMNFGVCKGLTLNRVLIFPNGPIKKFLKDPIRNSFSSPTDYFVAFSRARFSLVFVLDELDENSYFRKSLIKCESSNISALKFMRT